jgi:hypothetical protein
VLKVADTYFFLDTEWADLEGRELVSLGLISRDGESVFYAERDPLPVEPTGFVQSSVLPLLDRGSAALADREFTHELRTFLSAVPSPHVLYDYPNDGALLLSAISGFGLLPSELADVVAPPRHLKSSLLQDEALSTAIEVYFLTHPSEASRRHHALVDAKALRAAWLATQISKA